jgi:hypothetical protein
MRPAGGIGGLAHHERLRDHAQITAGSHQEKTNLIEQIEHRWLAAFRRTLDLSALSAREAVGIVTESQSRLVNVELAELAVQSLARPGPSAKARAMPMRSRVWAGA